MRRRKLKRRVKDVLKVRRRKRRSESQVEADRRNAKNQLLRLGKEASFAKKAALMKRLYKTKRYKDWRVAVFKRDGYRCVLCGKGRWIEAHHILRKWDYPELMFNVYNGMTLCGPSSKKGTCHEKVTGREYSVIGKLLQRMGLDQKRNMIRILKRKNIKWKSTTPAAAAS